MKINNRGQMTIWIILALILVAVMLLFFLVNRKATVIPGGSISPQPAIEKCVRTATQEALDIMLPQGGFLRPTNYKIYHDINVSYLCQNIGNFRPCINQHPMLLNEMKEEIRGYIQPKVERCFQDLKSELESRNNNVDMSAMNITISMGLNRVFVDVDRRLSIQKDETSQTFNKFHTEIANPAYDLGSLAILIADQQAKYCYFEYNGYMILYPKFDIKSYIMSDSTQIYTLKDRETGVEMNIAIKSCSIPPAL